MNELNQVNSANLFLILRRYLEKEKILLVEEKEREDKYLEDVSFFWRRTKIANEKEENIWRKKIFLCGEEEKWRRNRRKTNQLTDSVNIV